MLKNWQNTLMFPSLTLWDLIATHTLHQILKIVTDSFKTSKIGSVTPFKSDMEKLKKSIEFGERALTLPLDDSFSDEFRHIFSEYLAEKNKRFYV